MSATKQKKLPTHLSALDRGKKEFISSCLNLSQAIAECGNTVTAERICAGLRPPKSTACTTQIYRLSDLHPPNLQIVQACSPPKSVGWLVQMGEKLRNAND